ncbi:unnamed protein product [Chondrus crispus]|uniref:Uncharacterized protein n=1 Tax=Chondrus crispus TaxID=2769 RepID=R7QRI2_CHOCR|nr:unnamed protein product [Chondrus crispus]CDF40358.1 unnamed protein product [Chondrus crispus]|eukprot:XP_005710652.1 unnamed protein product [Chondrus crispus]
MHMLNKTSELLNLHGIRLVQAPIYTIYDEQFGKGRKSICPHILGTATPRYRHLLVGHHSHRLGHCSCDQTLLQLY